MKQPLWISILLGALLGAPPAGAHEFWMLPRNFAVAPGGAALLNLSVGEYFQGEQVAFSTSLIAALRQYSSGQIADLRGRVPANRQLPELPVVVPQAGTHLIALDTYPSQIVLSADKFHAYLHDEGLDFIIRIREASGTAASPGRERFRRNIKTLIQAGDMPDGTYAARTGQRLDIVPLANPFTKGQGDEVGFQILFDGKPLTDALVKAWHRRGNQTLIVRTISDSQGGVAITLPWAGTWMISVVHMIPVTDSPDHDWDSYWGNLTFALPDNNKK